MAPLHHAHRRAHSACSSRVKNASDSLATLHTRRTVRDRRRAPRSTTSPQFHNLALQAERLHTVGPIVSRATGRIPWRKSVYASFSKTSSDRGSRRKEHTGDLPATAAHPFVAWLLSLSA